MQERLMSRIKPLLDKWNELERNQQVKLAAGSITILLSIIAFVYIMTRPTMVTLIDNAEYSTILEAQQALDTEGISYTLTSDSKGLEVREEDHPVAKLTITQNTNIVTDKFTFQDALDAASFGMTEEYRRTALILSEAGKMEVALEKMNKIDTATVSLDIPTSTENILNSGKKPTAGISLGLNSPLDSQQAKSIASFVAASVVGLSTDEVTILDQDSNLIFGGGMESNASSEMQERAIVEKNTIINSVETMLAPLYDLVLVSPSVAINWDEEETVLEAYSPYGETTTGILSHEIIDTSQAENQSVGNEVGLGANDNLNTTYQVDGGGNYSGSSDYQERSYEVNKQVTSTKVTPGSIDKNNSSVSVIVYKLKEYDEKYMTDNGLLGDMTWSDFKNSVAETPIQIEDEKRELVQKASGLTDVSMAGYEVPVFIDYEPVPVNIQEIIIFVVLALLVLMLAIAIIRNTKVEEVEEIEPELSVQDLLISTQIEEEKEELETIKLREEDEKKQQITNFVADKPETAAQLLRNWLNEEWGEM